MRYLIDTHILIWWLEDDERLSESVRKILTDQDIFIYISVASFWEIGIKFQTKKLKLKISLETVFANIKFDMLPITLNHILIISKLPLHHKDPFDRMLIAQAAADKLTLITVDPKFKKYNVTVIDELFNK